MEGEWSCYRSNHFNGERMDHVMEMASLRRENGFVTEAACLMEGD